MDKPPRSITIVVIAVTVIALAFAGVACSDDEPTTSVDPREVFAAAVPAMKAVSSFAFAYDVEAPDSAEPAAGTVITRINGAVTLEGKMKATIDLLNRGIPLQIEFIADGETHYVKDPTSQKWQAIPAAMSPVGKLNLSAGTIQILEKVSDASYAGTEDLDGVTCDHLQGTVDAAQVAGIAGAATSDDPFAADVWIGVDDHLVRRIEIKGAATSAEDPETLRVIVLTDFGKPVVIEPPQ